MTVFLPRHQTFLPNINTVPVFVVLPKQSRSGVTSASYYQLDLQVCTEQELMRREQSEHELLLSGPEGDKVST